MQIDAVQFMPLMPQEKKAEISKMDYGNVLETQAIK